MKIEAVRKVKATSKYVNVPSTKRRTGNPSLPTRAPTTAVTTMESSGDLSFQLARAKVTTIAARTCDVSAYMSTPSGYLPYIAFAKALSSMALFR